MTEASSIIPLLFATLRYENERIICPWCDGGPGHVPTFTIAAVPGGYVFNCYRAGCSVRGGFCSATGVVTTLLKRRTRKARPYLKATRELTISQWDWLWSRYHIAESDALGDITYNPDDDRFILTVRGPLGQERGKLARSFDPTQRSKKVITYRDCMDNEPWLHWAVPETAERKIVLVEDYLSAIRVQRVGSIGVALLGTHLTQESLVELSTYQPEEVVVALDQDATDNAFAMMMANRLYFPRMRVAVLDKDLKDLETDKEVAEILCV